MESSKFTPGPWNYYSTGDGIGGLRFQITAPGETVAFILGSDKFAETMAANATLIAAAPDLLEALETLLTAVEVTVVLPGPKGAQCRAAAFAAIAKARGTSL